MGEVRERQILASPRAAPHLVHHKPHAAEGARSQRDTKLKLVQGQWLRQPLDAAPTGDGLGHVKQSTALRTVARLGGGMGGGGGRARAHTRRTT